MLEVEIKHDIDKNYLVIRGRDENTYMLKMLAGNSVKGFLDLEVRVLNNVNQYYYDITGKENFLQKSARSKWTEEEVRKMVADILGCLQKSKEYLLTPEHFVLEPQYLYRSMESGEVFLCYAWSYEKNINEQLTELFAYFMNVVDYEDDNAVDLIYKLYDISREENCTLQRLWSALSVPKVKRVVIEEEPVEEETEDEVAYKTRKPLGLKKQGERTLSKSLNQKKREKKPVPKPLNQKKREEKPVPKPLNQKKREEKLVPKSLNQKKQGEKKAQKLLSQERKKEKLPSNFLSAASKKNMENSNGQSVYRKSETSKKKKMKEEKIVSAENSMLLRSLLIVALQVVIIGVIFTGAKYGFFFENSGISYTKTGGTLLILGILDMYLMTKIFGVKELEEESDTEIQEVSEFSKEARNRKREKEVLSKRTQKTSPFVLAREIDQSTLDEVEYQENELQRKEQLEKRKNRIELEAGNNIQHEAYSWKRRLEIQDDIMYQKDDRRSYQNIGDEDLIRDNALVQNNRLDKELSLMSSVESQDLDGTVVLDYEKTIVDNRQLDLLQNKNKKVCYLVPDQKDYSLISLGEFPFFIGRFQKDTGSLKEIKNISRMHSKIEQIGNSFFITDLNSTNGTFVNQKRLEKDKKTELYEGDEIMFANVPYHFTMQEI